MIMMKCEIETERLQLVPCCLEDLSEIHALWTNDKVKYFLFDNRTISPEESRAFVETSVDNFAKRGYGIWLIYGRVNENFIGFAGLLKSDGEMPRLLYGLHPDYWKHGYATEAAQGVVDYAFNVLGFVSVASDVDEPNADSVRILERLGMKQTNRAVVNGNPILYYEITGAEARTK